MPKLYFPPLKVGDISFLPVFGHFRLAEGRQPIFTMVAMSRSWSSSLSWLVVATLLAFTFITTADTLHDAPELRFYNISTIS